MFNDISYIIVQWKLYDRNFCDSLRNMVIQYFKEIAVRNEILWKMEKWECKGI